MRLEKIEKGVILTLNRHITASIEETLLARKVGDTVRELQVWQEREVNQQ